MSKKATDKIVGATLNRLEHSILSLIQTCTTVPLYSIYSDMTRDLVGTDLTLVWSASARLLELGLVSAFYVVNSRTRVSRLTAEQLKRYARGRSEDELRKYPLRTGEYEFTITDKGRAEEAKDIYNDYYRES